MAYENKEVVKLVDSWKFTINSNGQTGFRKYIDATALPDADSEKLPKIGDSWSDEWPDCKLSSIEITYLQDSATCPKIYSCSYDYAPYIYDNIGGTKVAPQWEDLPITIESSSEMLSWEPPKYGELYPWFWLSDQDNVLQPIFKTIHMSTIRITRQIKDNKILEFLAISQNYQGKLNSATLFQMGRGQVLYNGFNATRIVGTNGKLWYNIELIFTTRSVTGGTGVGGAATAGENDGWNYQLREDSGSWDYPSLSPVGVDGLYKFPTDNFELLRTSYAFDDTDANDLNDPEN